MKKLVFLLLSAGLLLSGCARQPDNGSFGSAQQPAWNGSAWEEIRRQLPENKAQTEVFESVAVKGDPNAREAAAFLSGALIAYPDHPVELGTDSPPDNLFLLQTGLLNTDGIQFGEPGTQGALFRQLEDMLGHPGGFLTREQVEAEVKRYFPAATLEHQSVPVGEDGDSYQYRGDLGIYLYPQGEARWYLPVLLNYGEDVDGACWTQIAFVRSAREAGEAYWDWSGTPIGAWEVEDQILANPDKYPRYQVELRRTEEGFSLESVTPLPLEE